MVEEVYMRWGDGGRIQFTNYVAIWAISTEAQISTSETESFGINWERWRSYSWLEPISVHSNERNSFLQWEGATNVMMDTTLSTYKANWTNLVIWWQNPRRMDSEYDEGNKSLKTSMHN